MEPSRLALRSLLRLERLHLRFLGGTRRTKAAGERACRGIKIDRAQQVQTLAGARMKLLSSLAVFSGILLIRSVNSAIAVGGSPWENAINVLTEAFTGPIARGLSLVAIV